VTRNHIFLRVLYIYMCVFIGLHIPPVSFGSVPLIHCFKLHKWQDWCNFTY